MKKTFRYQGQDVPGEDLEFEAEKESFNEYRLSDGTTLRMKLVITRVARLDKYKDDGEPIYIMQSQNVVATDVPQHLRKGTKESPDNVH